MDNLLNKPPIINVRALKEKLQSFPAEIIYSELMHVVMINSPK
jgi:hypothetical protein